MSNIKLQELKEEYTNCTNCEELCKSRSQIVFGSGNENATILLVGEAPGKTEDERGIPFCGASGQILQELLASIGFTRDEVFITNTVICRPENNRNPKTEEIKNCSDRLHKTIQAINPKVIATVGNFASKKILGKDANAGITKIRGKIFEHEFLGKNYFIVPVVHPANLLYNGRNPEIFKQMKEDFQTIKKASEKETKQKPQMSLGDF